MLAFLKSHDHDGSCNSSYNNKNNNSNNNNYNKTTCYFILNVFCPWGGFSKHSNGKQVNQTRSWSSHVCDSLSPNRTSGKIKSPNKQTLMEQWIKRAWQSAAPMPHNKDKRQDLEHRRTQLPNHKVPLWPNLKLKYSSYTSLSLSQIPEQEVDWTNQQAGLICKSSETHTPSVFEYEQHPSFPKSWSKMKLKQKKIVLFHTKFYAYLYIFHGSSSCHLRSRSNNQT